MLLAEFQPVQDVSVRLDFDGATQRVDAGIGGVGPHVLGETEQRSVLQPLPRAQGLVDEAVRSVVVLDRLDQVLHHFGQREHR